MKNTGIASAIVLVALLSVIPAGRAYALVITETYDELLTLVSIPDPVYTGVPVNLTVSGELIGGSAFDVFAYSLYSGAEWRYDSNHLAEVTAGTLVDADGFNFGYSLQKDYALSFAGGRYSYTFIFGQRTSGHGFYDLAIDVEFETLEITEVPEPASFVLFMAGLATLLCRRRLIQG